MYKEISPRSPSAREWYSGCDCAIMSAAKTSGATVLTKQPWQQVTENAIMNTVMLQAFFEQGIKRVVYISSASLYQESEGYIKEGDLDFNKEPHIALHGYWLGYPFHRKALHILASARHGDYNS